MILDINKNIYIYKNDNFKNNYFDINYIANKNYDIIRFNITFNYDENLFDIICYKPEKTVPYNYEKVINGQIQQINYPSDISDYKNFFIKIKKNDISFSSKITINIVTQNNTNILKTMDCYYNVFENSNVIDESIDSNLIYNGILFDNNYISDILHVGSYVSKLSYLNLTENLTFDTNNEYVCLKQDGDNNNLILKKPLINYKDDYLTVLLIISYTYNNIKYTFEKPFNFKINKNYFQLTKINQNYNTYVGEPCWLTYNGPKLLHHTINLYKYNDNLNIYELFENDLTIPLFIPQDIGTYKLIIYNYFDRIESVKYFVTNKPITQQIIEMFSVICKSN